MREILQPIERATVEGEEMVCADGRMRRCFPVLCGIIADYQEQTLITGVKSNQHCTICKVPPNERGDLTGTRWPFRTHADTKLQIRRQIAQNIHPNKAEWVHDMECFAWHHEHFNVHEGMLVDTLHQLLKGLVMYTVKWIQQLVGDTIPKRRVAKDGRATLRDKGGRSQLDQRFRDVPSYTALRRFSRVDFSKITQWTGDEQKAIVQQLVAVVTPILCEHEPYAVHFTKAVCDFVTIAQYRSHDDDTLTYLDDALKRIDALKHVFESFRPRRRDRDSVGHFNIPKLHGLTHWRYFIQSRGSPDGYDTGPNGEAPHNYLLKEMYKLTNRREFLTQLGRLNSRMIAVQSTNALFTMASSIETTAATQQFEDVRLTIPTAAVEPTSLGWGMGRAFSKRWNRVRVLPTAKGTWLSIAEVTKESGIVDLPTILYEFVDSQTHTLASQDSPLMTKEASSGCRTITRPAWADTAMLEIHPSLTCWRREGKHATDTEHLTKQFLRSRPWGQSQEWRRDFVIANEFGYRTGPTPHPRDASQRLYGKTVGQLDLIFTIRIESAGIVGDHGHAHTFTGAVLDRLKQVNQGRPHCVHGMIELEKAHTMADTNRGTLGSRKAFSMSAIWRGVHIVPAATGSKRVFINNYIDFELYNTLYSPSFQKDGERVIKAYAAHRKRIAKGPSTANATAADGNYGHVIPRSGKRSHTSLRTGTRSRPIVDSTEEEEEET
ncbi:hypothetical protein NX059_003723 [Plenodomus lindquistii]|nr:hypothetical protein NX059_003723 [Plenodomus lindquistii]